LSERRLSPSVATQRAYLGVGSNLGDRLGHGLAAVAALDQLTGTRVVACSRWYETEPVGVEDHPWFLNAVVEVETSLSPCGLLAACLVIERARGRERRVPADPRPLDLDLLLYADRVINDPGLILPHPRLTQRAFVVIPLAEIAPRVVHPVAGLTIVTLREQLADRHVVRPYLPAGLVAG
jgi:2-amino-4-hydroxy-6-hydroxymethyldihydropteridine diphosphokinase